MPITPDARALPEQSPELLAALELFKHPTGKTGVAAPNITAAFSEGGGDVSIPIGGKPPASTGLPTDRPAGVLPTPPSTPIPEAIAPISPVAPPVEEEIFPLDPPFNPPPDPIKRSVPTPPPSPEPILKRPPPTPPVSKSRRSPVESLPPTPPEVPIPTPPPSPRSPRPPQPPSLPSPGLPPQAAPQAGETISAAFGGFSSPAIGLTGGDISPADQISAILGRPGRGAATRRAVPGASPGFASEPVGLGDEGDDLERLLDELLGGGF